MYCNVLSVNCMCAVCNIVGSSSFHFLRIMAWPLAHVGVPCTHLFIHLLMYSFIEKTMICMKKMYSPALKDLRGPGLSLFGVVWIKLPVNQISVLLGVASVSVGIFRDGVLYCIWFGAEPSCSLLFLFAIGPVKHGHRLRLPFQCPCHHLYPTVRMLGIFLWAFRIAYPTPWKLDPRDRFSMCIYCVT